MFSLRLHAAPLLAGAALLSTTSLASQNFNLDFGTTYATLPNTYGAASGNAGEWVNVDHNTPTSLVNTSGDPTSASLLVGPGWNFLVSPTPTTNAAALLQDNLRHNGSTNQVPPRFQAEFTGLEDGLYDVYYYSVRNFDGPVTINGTPLPSLTGLTFPLATEASLTQGVTWDVITDVEVEGGILNIYGSTNAQTSLSGLQLVRTSRATPFIELCAGDPSPSAGPGIDFYMTLKAGNFDGDNYPDFVVERQNEQLTIMLNSGPPSFTYASAPALLNGLTGFNPRVADIDNDGLDDVFVVSGSEIRFLLMNGLSGWQALPLLDTALDVVASDFDGDGDIDLCGVTQSGLEYFENLSGCPSGCLLIGSSYAVAMNPGTSSSNLKAIVGDFDGDGLEDDVWTLYGALVQGNATPGGWSASSFVVAGTFKQNPGAPSFENVSLVKGDWNKDGVDDLAMTRNAQCCARPAMALFTSTSPGSIGYSRSEHLPNQSCYAAAAGDFDGDGYAEIFASRGSGGFVGELRAPFTSSFETPIATTSPILACDVADVNADGFLDVIGAHINVVQVYFGSGCQCDLGFQGPGNLWSSLCGNGLGSGQTSDYVITGGQPNAAAVLLISLPNNPNVTLFPAANPGVLASGAGILIGAPRALDQNGELSLPISGVGVAVDLVMQTVAIDSAVLPHNAAFSNAVLARFKL